MSVSDALSKLKNELPEHVVLVAVSKVHPVEHIMKAYDAGHREFGENRVQELTEKAAQMPKDIHWHLIGHLQRNKVKYIAEFVHLIHSVDSLKLLREIDKQGEKAGRVIDVLLQLHIADEETKFGLDFEECKSLLKSDELRSMSNVRIRGMMGMATFTDDVNQVRAEFRKLNQFFKDTISNIPPSSNWQPEILSMGMSGDYSVAIEEGSTMVRVGSKIFGER